MVFRTVLMLMFASAAVGQTCVTVPSEGSTAIIGTPCSFPFEYNGVFYDECTTDDSFDGQPWCFTDDGFWGTCNCNGDVPCITTTTDVTTAAEGSPCTFPFEYNGTMRDSCITDNNFGIPWCMTGDDTWGECLCDAGLGYGVYPEPIGFYECVTTEGAFTTAAEGTFCSFPFEYNGVTYNDCTTADNNDVPWCATEDGLWGECYCYFVSNLQCTTKETEPFWPSPVAEPGSDCVFPFEFNGELHYKCVGTDSYPTPFCRTLDGSWGDCECANDVTAPEPTPLPTSSPTNQPTPEPTPEPTPQPTTMPTNQPTAEPTAASEGSDDAPGATFDFGGCGAGDGDFTITFNNPGESQVLGQIPALKGGVRVALSAEEDLDINLYDLGVTDVYEEGLAIVGWCKLPCNKGLLAGSSEASVDYRNMTITYSGYNGQGGQRGNEFIEVEGIIPSDLNMGVLAYKAGTAKVTYSWASSHSPCCLGQEACGGDFSAPILLKDVVDIGEIPSGKLNLRITLESDEDVDIQLYDLEQTDEFAEGKAIIAYCSKSDPTCNAGALGNNNGSEESTIHKGLEYKYSGYKGVDGQKGHEFIEINGLTNTRLMMKAFGYRAGSAKITYEYYELSAERQA